MGSPSMLCKFVNIYITFYKVINGPLNGNLGQSKQDILCNVFPILKVIGLYTMLYHISSM